MLKRILSRSAERIARNTDRVFVERFIKANRSAGASRDVPEDVHRERIATIERWTDAQSSPAFIDDPDTFFPQPETAHAEAVEVSRKGDVRTIDLSWRSKFQLFHREVAHIYNAPRPNHQGRARLVTRSTGGAMRPVVVCIHGYRGGYYSMEQRVWPVDVFLAAGFDVAFFVLPHHGPRMAEGSKRPLIPNADVRLTVDAMRQAILDLRALVQILERSGARAVGVTGMCLGGYVTALGAPV